MIHIDHVKKRSLYGAKGEHGDVVVGFPWPKDRGRELRLINGVREVLGLQAHGVVLRVRVVGVPHGTGARTVGRNRDGLGEPVGAVHLHAGLARLAHELPPGDLVGEQGYQAQHGLGPGRSSVLDRAVDDEAVVQARAAANVDERDDVTQAPPETVVWVRAEVKRRPFDGRQEPRRDLRRVNGQVTVARQLQTVVIHLHFLFKRGNGRLRHKTTHTNTYTPCVRSSRSGSSRRGWLG